MIRNGKAIDHSNVGNVGGSAVVFLVCYVAFLGCLYAMGFWRLDNAWVPGLIALVLAVVTFIIPQGILGRGDTLHTQAIHGTQTPAVRPAAATTTTHRAAGAHAADGRRH